MLGSCASWRQALSQARELGCWIDVERMVYQRDSSGAVMLIGGPDDTVAVDPAASEWHQPAAVALAAPRAVHKVVLDPDERERFKQDYLVVRELGNFTRVAGGRGRA